MHFPRVVLKAGKDKPVRAFHPWIFSGAIDLVDESCKPGGLVSVHAKDNSFLGIGYFNSNSQISVRMLTFKQEEISADFFKRKIETAVELRKSFISENTNAYRLIHSEGDFLPGLIVDRYADFLVVQFQTLGIEVLKPSILEALKSIGGIQGIYERCDPAVNKFEGMDKKSAVLFGSEPPELVETQENGCRFYVDIHNGQKTGFFLDQRDNRKLIGKISKGKRVLNCFSYTGGFSIYARKGGASEVTSVEISEKVTELAKKNFQLNQIESANYKFISQDVFDYLREDKAEYDLIILDPPAFCKNKHQVMEASRGYKDINLFAMKRLAQGGILFTASCSSHISQDLFQKIIFAAAKDAKRDVQVLKKTAHPMDHPVNIYHPEGEYLKGLLCRVI